MWKEQATCDRLKKNLGYHEESAGAVWNWQLTDLKCFPLSLKLNLVCQGLKLDLRRQ